jgi:hypothetical protein
VIRCFSYWPYPGVNIFTIFTAADSWVIIWETWVDIWTGIFHPIFHFYSLKLGGFMGICFEHVIARVLMSYAHICVTVLWYPNCFEEIRTMSLNWITSFIVRYEQFGLQLLIKFLSADVGKLLFCTIIYVFQYNIYLISLENSMNEFDLNLHLIMSFFYAK